MALTREPSGRRASTIGEDSSTLRPTRDTMRSMICIKWRSSRNTASILVRIPFFSINTLSLPLTRMSEISRSRSKGSSGPRPKTSSRRSDSTFSCSLRLNGTRWVVMISPIILATAWRAWLLLMRDSFSRSIFGISVRCTSALNFSRLSCSTLCHPYYRCENFHFYFIQINETVSSFPGPPADHTLFWPSDGLHLLCPNLPGQAE